MADTEGAASAVIRRRGTDLEKFKRRMIRSVARRIREKKSDEEVWEDMKKEVGSNCKKLWERMRMLTLKKLKRLLEADDRVDVIGPIARMTLTDWLLFDLVIVHEKIDVINREKLTGDYHSKVLSNLFSLVQRFEIEEKSGDELAEAWTSATVYYNSKGHQCSPMMLQRRWYQIKELTRHKFYKFWFNYRGNQRQLTTAKQDSPNDLQKAIAIKYPGLITQKILSWEEAIEKRLVILPDELGVKMKKKNLMKPSDINAPDVVLVEKYIETIDLGDSDSDEDEDEEVEKTQPATLANVKTEPVDVDEELQAEHEVYIPPEKGSEFDEEIERLQMVEDNFDDGEEDNIGNTEAVVIDPVPTVDDFEEESPSNEVTETVSDDISRIVDENLTKKGNNEEAIVIDDDDDDKPSAKDCVSTVKVEQVEADVIASGLLVETDRYIDEAVAVDSQIETVDESNRVLAEITSVATAGIKVENLEDVIEMNRTDFNEQTTGDASEGMLPVISTISSAGIKVEKGLINVSDTSIGSDLAIASIDEEDLEKHDETMEALPVITTVSSVKVENTTEPIDGIEDLTEEPNDAEEHSENDPADDDADKPKDPTVVKNDGKVNDLDFGDLPMDLNFADDDIDFADDGIAYVEEDDEDIIKVTDQQLPESETAERESTVNEEQKESLENTDEDSIDEEDITDKIETPSFDLKLLMYPVVYTTKLDAMSVFADTSCYNQVCDKNSIDKINALSKPISKQSVTGSERVIEQDEHNNYSTTSDLNNEQASKSDTAEDEGDDDLFKSDVVEESDDSESESEVIDDSKRVKLSSHMLQKPKHRSYNPVLLCKNPDFNTRLKKLTVGFFMSARNRTLLQSCMPMTIDMTKAFEDKLVNGTLYLKPTPKDSTPSIALHDDVEISSSALVKPSAVHQSLMSIDDTLENELKKRMAERMRAINLPDISEVRRLNQHLLTAEVTPLKLQNEISQDINKRKIGPACYVQNIKNDINNLLLQQKVIDVPDDDTNKNNDVTEKQPLTVSPVTVNSPVQPALLMEPNKPVPIAQPTPVPPQVSNNTAPSKSIGNASDPNTATTSGTNKTRKAQRKTVYPALAWNKRPSQINQQINQSDALLTIDTLYKMLSALDPGENLYDIYKKKSHKKAPSSKKNEEKQKDDTTNQDAVIDITDDEVPVKPPKQKSKSTVVRQKLKQYCCWCNYRVAYIQRNVDVSCPKRRHKCKVGNCVCCCKTLYYSGDLASVTDNTVEQKEDPVSKTIEQVVQQVIHQEAPDGSVPINLDDDVMNVESLNNAVLTRTTSDTIVETSLDNSNNDTAELTVLPSKTKQPTPKFRVYTGASKSNSGQTMQSLKRLNDNFTPTVQTYSRHNDIATPHKDGTEVTDISMNFSNEESIKKTIIYKGRPSLKAPSKSSNPCTCLPSISTVNKGKIEINGKNSCTLHKKLNKESKIVLSKKLITNENQPFFVGKGKILLTNVKMPIQKPDVHIASPVVPIAPAPMPQQPVVQAVSLPTGVQIVLLPDQTLTYIIQPNVTLTPEECAILPQFLVALQQQLNAVGITLPVPFEDEGSNLYKVASPNETGLNKVDNGSAKEITALETTDNLGMEVDSIAKDTPGGEKTKNDDDIEMSIDTVASEKKSTDLASAIDNISETTSAGVSVENPIPVTDSIINTNEQQHSNADDATNKKSLLSDLMEMSGIMEEDLTPAPVVVATPQPIILDTQNFVLQREVPREEVVPQTNEIPMPSLSPIRKTSYIASHKSGNFELTAVTSFAELKYSCDNNGIFFKLDLESGQLTSINVCIQKFPSKESMNSKNVIDLTDDPDISITGPTDVDKSVIVKRSIVTLNETSPPNKTRISTILQKKQRLMERLSNNLKPVNILQSKRHVARILKRNKTLHKDPQFTFYSKHKLNKIDAQIDLVDSDASMEEEYLENDGSGESSDDEPLIKKVKRKNGVGASNETDQAADKLGAKEHLNEQVLEQQDSGEVTQLNVEGRTIELKQQNVPTPSEQQSKTLTHSEKQMNVGENQLNEEEYLDEQDSYEQDEDSDQADEEMADLSQKMPPVPTNLVLSGGALNAHNIPLNTMFREDGDDSQDEDCILGV